MQRPCTYRIRLEGELVSSLPDRLGAVEVTVEPRQGGNPVTVLRGTLLDQAALAGVLENVYELSLPLLSVEVLDPADTNGRCDWLRLVSGR